MRTFYSSSIAAKVLTKSSLQSMRRGVEKEGLRTTATGELAQTAHPTTSLGSTLTHPHITTDFCEQQIELVTSVHDSCQGLHDELLQLQAFVAQSLAKLGDERIWCASMPGGLPPEKDIQLGQYGSSNQGRFKTTYRSGLALRYGKLMQTISGMHYNWSMVGLTSDDYFALMRNFRRNAPLLVLLFGASPVVDKTFLTGRDHNLEALSEDTYYLPYATSLRLGRLGYQSDAQNSRHIPFNCLEDFCDRLEKPLTEKYPPYEVMGWRDASGEFLQLNTCLLQIENELYNPIRAKCVPLPDERVLHGLRSRGVEYVEVRVLDLNPFVKVGVTCHQIAFLDVFLVHALCKNSPLETEEEIEQSMHNLRAMSERGRDPALTLLRKDGHIAVNDCLQQLMDELLQIAVAMDKQLGVHYYVPATLSQQDNLRHPERLLSRQILDAVQQQPQKSWKKLAQQKSQRIMEELLAVQLSPTRVAAFTQESVQSIQHQILLEQGSTSDFEAYLAQFFDPSRLVPYHDKFTNLK